MMPIVAVETPRVICGYPLGSVGLPLRQAVLKSAEEIALPGARRHAFGRLLLSPRRLAHGVGRSLFLPLAMAVVCAILPSYLLARTLVPAMMDALLGRSLRYRPRAALRGGARDTARRWSGRWPIGRSPAACSSSLSLLGLLAAAAHRAGLLPGGGCRAAAAARPCPARHAPGRDRAALQRDRGRHPPGRARARNRADAGQHRPGRLPGGYRERQRDDRLRRRGDRAQPGPGHRSTRGIRGAAPGARGALSRLHVLFPAGGHAGAGAELRRPAPIHIQVVGPYPTEKRTTRWPSRSGARWRRWPAWWMPTSISSPTPRRCASTWTGRAGPVGPDAADRRQQPAGLPGLQHPGRAHFLPRSRERDAVQVADPDPAVPDRRDGRAAGDPGRRRDLPQGLPTPLLSNLATTGRATAPAIVTHVDTQPAFDVFASVENRDLGGRRATWNRSWPQQPAGAAGHSASSSAGRCQRCGARSGDSGRADIAIVDALPLPFFGSLRIAWCTRFAGQAAGISTILAPASSSARNISGKRRSSQVARPRVSYTTGPSPGVISAGSPSPKPKRCTFRYVVRSSPVAPSRTEVLKRRSARRARRTTPCAPSRRGHARLPATR